VSGAAVGTRRSVEAQAGQSDGPVEPAA
jgi:hypothetical protein